MYCFSNGLPFLFNIHLSFHFSLLVCFLWFAAHPFGYASPMHFSAHFACLVRPLLFLFSLVQRTPVEMEKRNKKDQGRHEGSAHPSALRLPMWNSVLFYFLSFCVMVYHCSFMLRLLWLAPFIQTLNFRFKSACELVHFFSLVRNSLFRRCWCFSPTTIIMVQKFSTTVYAIAGGHRITVWSDDASHSASPLQYNPLPANLCRNGLY